MKFEKGNKFGKGRPKGSKNKEQNYIMSSVGKYKGKSVVYVMGLRGLGFDCFFKIGKTTNLERRIKDLSSRLPVDVQLHHAIVLDPSKIGFAEKRLHRFFRKNNVRLEWFDLSRDKLNFILTLDSLEDIEKLEMP